ncbi:hypothetical protein CTA2_2580 [Colletotrichum tanaceti]|uniref:PD-(D/E)XK nuclease-like domain-containing protein n=1 Tax=Colletotrichum tanaceti TaxID=1306861 RepID=A0A4U6XW29_9PEZI|nr:hypothetical protein CTA2_2580 [Colletotrichum tanaceti]TKW60089.1 hypothetical protein CTA1_3109 [Colletotrichum tanaceti]
MNDRVDCYVSHWLGGLPDFSTTTSWSPCHQLASKAKRRQSRKRPRSPTKGLAMTPPPSLRDESADARNRDDSTSYGQSSHPETPMAKKRRLSPNATPRQHPVVPSDSASQSRNMLLEKTPSVSSASTRSGTSRSRTSSPTKAFAGLEISNPLKLRFDDFDDPYATGTMPPGLHEVRRHLGLFSQSQNIIPSRDRDSTVPLFRNSPFPPTDAAYFDDDQEPCRYGPLVAVDDVLAIVGNSSSCRKNHVSEAIWNAEVHLRVLLFALRPDIKRMGAGPVNFAACNSASIHSHLLRRGQRAQSKMVDYCLYVDSEVATRSDPRVEDAISRLRADSPSEAVNHTDYAGVRRHPLALSIESKTPGGSVEAATLQVGTWHAAQWKFLESILNDGDGGDLACLEFLPGLIVQGSDWWFVASTRGNGETTLWTKQYIASTSSPLGTYQVLRAIQYLAWWCQEKYWPWFTANVLSLDDSPPV